MRISNWRRLSAIVKKTMQIVFKFFCSLGILHSSKPIPLPVLAPCWWSPHPFTFQTLVVNDITYNKHYYLNSLLQLEIKPNTNLLSRIKGKDWYPTLQKKTLPTVDTVLDDMVSALKTENCGEYIKDICESFKNIER